jgi:hypothetical protein
MRAPNSPLELLAWIVVILVLAALAFKLIGLLG